MEEEDKKEEQSINPETTDATSEASTEAKVPITPSRRESRRGKKINKKIFVIGIVVLAVVAGGFYLLREPKVDIQPLPDSELTTAEEETPTSTPTPVPEPVNKEEISIQVLNGTGIAKEASFLQDKLSELGYSEIEVGNVDEQDYSTTVVTYTMAVQDEVKDEINDELEGLYEEVDTKEGTLTDFDIQIIAGLRKGQTFPTATPEPTAGPTISPTPTATTSATPTP